MDLSAPARDILNIVTDFVEFQGTELEQMKSLWRSRGFSLIHEARPKDVVASFYIQALFSSALSHIIGDAPLSQKLGGLYVLYTLYGTQPDGTRCLIYLSLEELEAIYSLVKEIKKKRFTTALKVVRKMFEDEIFLYGSVSANQKRIAATVDKLAAQASARVKRARMRLMNNVPAREHCLGSLTAELDLEKLGLLTADYALAKQRAFSGNLRHEIRRTDLSTREAEQAFRDDFIEDVEAWDSQKAQLLNLVKGNTLSVFPHANSLRSGHPRGRESQGADLTQIKLSECDEEFAAQLDLDLEED